MVHRPLRVRWLGRVPYRDAHALQHALFHGLQDYLLLLEHSEVYTRGVSAKDANLLVSEADLGAPLVRADRGGDITYHGPGQLVGYPIRSIEMGPGSIPAHVHRVEDLLLATLRDLGLSSVGRLPDYPGVWVDPDSDNPRKICAIGVRVSRGRTMHGFALNVDPDLGRFERIVPCGIAEYPVTSLAAEGIEVTMARVVDAVVARAALLVDGITRGREPAIERQDAVSFTSSSARVTIGAGRALDRRLAGAGVDSSTAVRLTERKPAWLRVEAQMGTNYLGLRKTMRELDLVTVCEEAGCPNIYECWLDGTATFMINGERCTRACGFCLVDTGHPLPLDPDEPSRVADAAARMNLSHVVVTAVARDDLADGGASGFASTITALRERLPLSKVEVLIPDCKGDERSLGQIFDARPDVLNHNLETVLRLQRAVRPSASYARSLAVLARAKAAGLTTKSGIILGMGERAEEVRGALGDLAAVGVDIVTLGQYLRPSAAHLPVARWWTPEEFDELRSFAIGLGFAHVEASPLTRSSYHAREGANAADERLASA